MSVNAMETLLNPIHHSYISHNTPRSRCLQFLLGQLEIPKRNWKQWLLHAKSWGVSEMYYGQCGTDGLSLSIKTDYEVKNFFGMKCGIFFLACNNFFKPRLSAKCISSSNLQVYLLWIWASFISLRMVHALFSYGMKWKLGCVKRIVELSSILP